MITVVILDGQTIQTLPIAKKLIQQGHYVILLCDNRKSYGFNTKYANEKYLVPSTKEHVDKFHIFFIEFIQRRRIDVAIPMNDYSAHYLSYNKAILSSYTRFIIPPYDVFMKGYDKNKLMGICEAKGFPHPKTYDLSKENFIEAVNLTGFPALIKPNITTGARGFEIVNSTSELIQKYYDIQSKFGNCHLQEFIPDGNIQFKVQLFIKDNELINSSVIRKIRYYPEKGGSSCYNQTIKSDDLVIMCFELLKILEWEGFADFDLIQDPRDKVIKIMEINPRIPACIKASFNAGINFAENIVDGSLGLSLKKYEYNPGNYLRYLGLDILWLLKTKHPIKLKLNWFRGFLTSSHYFQDGSIDDLKPVIYGNIGGLIKQFDSDFRAAKKGMV